MTSRDIPPQIVDARYARDQKAVRCESIDGFKTRAARLCEHLNGRYSGREKAYIMSPRKAERLMVLYAAGRDASCITGKLDPCDDTVIDAPVN